MIAEPGLTPTCPPSMTDGPVFVTVVPARTAKSPAVPSVIGAASDRAAKLTNVVNDNNTNVIILMLNPPFG